MTQVEVLCVQFFHRKKKKKTIAAIQIAALIDMVFCDLHSLCFFLEASSKQSASVEAAWSESLSESQLWSIFQKTNRSGLVSDSQGYGVAERLTKRVVA